MDTFTISVGFRQSSLQAPQTTGDLSAEAISFSEKEPTNKKTQRLASKCRRPMLSSPNNTVAVLDAKDKHSAGLVRHFFRAGYQVVIVRSDCAKNLIALEVFFSTATHSQECAAVNTSPNALADLLAECSSVPGMANQTGVIDAKYGTLREIIKARCPPVLCRSYLNDLRQATIINAELIVFSPHARSVVAMLAAEVFDWSFCSELNSTGRPLHTYLFAAKTVLDTKRDCFIKFLEALENRYTTFPGTPKAGEAENASFDTDQSQPPPIITLPDNWDILCDSKIVEKECRHSLEKCLLPPSSKRVVLEAPPTPCLAANSSPRSELEIKQVEETLRAKGLIL